MASTKERDGALEISNISANWDYATEKPGHWPEIPRIASISYHPGGADIFIVRQRDAAGVRRMQATTADIYDDRIKYFHGSRVVPFINYGECTLNLGHLVVIELWRDP